MKKNLTLLGYAFPKFATVEDVVMEVSKNARFRRPLDKHYAKWSQTLSVSAPTNKGDFIVLPQVNELPVTVN